LNNQTKEAGMWTAFGTFRAEEKRMQVFSRGTSRRHNLETNGGETGQNSNKSEITGWENMNWIYLAQDKTMWQSLVNTQRNVLSIKSVSQTLQHRTLTRTANNKAEGMRKEAGVG
jgi:hypothetical protein